MDNHLMSNCNVCQQNLAQHHDAVTRRMAAIFSAIGAITFGSGHHKIEVLSPVDFFSIAADPEIDFANTLLGAAVGGLCGLATGKLYEYGDKIGTSLFNRKCTCPEDHSQEVRNINLQHQSLEQAGIPDEQVDNSEEEQIIESIRTLLEPDEPFEAAAPT